MRQGVIRGRFEIIAIKPGTPPSYHPIVKMKLNLKSIPSQKENLIKALLICLKTLKTKTMLVTGKFEWVCGSPHLCRQPCGSSPCFLSSQIQILQIFP